MLPKRMCVVETAVQLPVHALPVGGEEVLEGDHEAWLGVREYAARGGGLSVALGNCTPGALPNVVHVRLESRFNLGVVREEHACRVVVCGAGPGLETADHAGRIARREECAVVVIPLDGPNLQDDGALLDVERFESRLDPQALVLVARALRPRDQERTTRIERTAVHATDVVRRASARQARTTRSGRSAAARFAVRRGFFGGERACEDLRGERGGILLPGEDLREGLAKVAPWIQPHLPAGGEKSEGHRQRGARSRRATRRARSFDRVPSVSGRARLRCW